MSYQDEKNEHWADARCVVCDRHLDRRGNLCWHCWEIEQAKKQEEESKMARLMAPWEFLNEQLQKLFKPKT